jgi:hypothetical protein
MINFKDQLFNRCFDCGWGEKGVHDYGMTYDQVVTYLKSINEETAERFIEAEDGYFEFRYGDDYIISENCFDAEQWEGSDDY